MELQQHNNRIQSIDLIRGLSTAFLVVIHTLWMYGDVHTQSQTWLGHIIHFLGKGTGMFLVTMGFSFTLSRNQSFLLSIKRGFYLLYFGYVLNLLKFILPALFGMLPDDFIKAYGWTPPATPDQLQYMLLTGDILQMAGLSLFILGAVNHFSKNKYVPLVLALLIAFSANFVRGTHLGITGVDYVLDLFWSATYNVYFAVFPWASLILIGVFFGRVYRDTNHSQKQTFRQMLYYGTASFVIGAGLCWYDFKYHFGEFFHLGFGGTLYLAGFSLLAICIGQVAVTRISPNRVYDFLYYLSKRVTSIYMIQWTLVCWGMSIVGYQKLNAWQLLLALPVMMALTFGVQVLRDQLSASNQPKKEKLIEEKKQKEKEMALA